MSRVTLAACLAVAAIWALAVFACVELDALACRAWRWIARA